MIKNKRGKKDNSKKIVSTNKNKSFLGRIDRLEKDINNDVRKVERWVIARRKFIFKLAFLTALILLLFLLGYIFESM